MNSKEEEVQHCLPGPGSPCNDGPYTGPELSGSARSDLTATNAGSSPLFPALAESFQVKPNSKEKKSGKEHPSTDGVGPDTDSSAEDRERWARGENIFASSNTRSKTDRLRSLKEKTKDELKQKRHHFRHKDHEKKLVEALDSSDSHRTKSRLSGKASQTAAFLTHPKNTIKAKVTNTVATEISALNEPSIPQHSDIEFVAAHVRKDCARDVREMEHAERTIAELKTRRRNMRLGWTMGRHIHTVRAVSREVRPWPEKRELLLRDEKGDVPRDSAGYEQMDWVRWLGHFLLYMAQDFSFHYIEERQENEPLSIDRMRGIAERIFISSAPWQEWLLHRIGAFVYAYICYGTLRNYFFPSTVEGLMASIERSRSRSMDAYRFGELVDQYGPEGWLYPLADDLGPWAQLQLGDCANLLEVLKNFWDWASPRQTLYTLCFFFTCLVVSAVGDMELCMKIVYFVLGGTFFFSFPISSHYPRYRYLVSTLKWVFWNVPTHAEWAFEELRLAAQNEREEFISAKVEETYWTKDSNSEDASPTRDGNMSDAEDDVSDAESFVSASSSSAPVLVGDETLSKFKCRAGLEAGWLVMMPGGIRFETRRHQTRWKRAWSEIAEMQKDGRLHGMAKLASSSTALEFVFTDRTKVRLDDLGNVRDEVFNRVLGVSGLRWQWVN